ncbi:MAG: hypothetical protein IPP91_05330 [Betaproteobacteria bacterium]|nr:hypothetical protein [Betaproteobacteria bacterium]
MRPAPLALLLVAACAMASSPRDDGKARAFAHDLKPGGIAEECLRLEAGNSRRFEWFSNLPVDFNIHFHQGDTVTYPVKLNGQRKGGGRFTATVGEDYCWMWTAKAATRVTGRIEE